MTTTSTLKTSTTSTLRTSTNSREIAKINFLNDRAISSDDLVAQSSQPLAPFETKNQFELHYVMLHPQFYVTDIELLGNKIRCRSLKQIPE